MRGAQGLVWLRTGFYAGRNDVCVFAAEVLSTLTGPTVLITTDGDRDMPGPADVMREILASDFIVAWYTQNLTDTTFSEKLHALPIGLDLHSHGTSADDNWDKVRAAIQHQLPWAERSDSVWCDVQHGRDRAFGTRELVRDTKLSCVAHSDSRQSRDTTWSKYGSHKMVLSLPGNGLDCHRTYEAALMGAVIVTVHTALDTLFAKMELPILFVDASTFSELDDIPGLVAQANALMETRESSTMNKWLQRDTWLSEMRTHLINTN